MVSACVSLPVAGGGFSDGEDTMENILVVDDQRCIRQLVFEELTQEGYSVRGVANAASLWKHLTSSPPDLVLLDLYLDDANGFSLLPDIKRQHPNMPVIIFTAYDSYAEDSRLCQADGYVIKSCDLDQLKQKIANLLSHGAPPQVEVRPKTDFASYSIPRCWQI